MISRMDIWRSAKLLVDQHGADAPIRTAQRADELLAQGNFEGQATWRRIARAAEELRRMLRRVGERAN